MAMNELRSYLIANAAINNLFPVYAWTGVRLTEEQSKHQVPLAGHYNASHSCPLAHCLGEREKAIGSVMSNASNRPEPKFSLLFAWLWVVPAWVLIANQFS